MSQALAGFPLQLSSKLAGRLAAPLFFAVLALTLFAWPGAGAAGELRPGTPWAEPWRLLSGHFTHFTAEHLAWDLLVFVTLAALFPARRLLPLLATAALAVSLGVSLGSPELPSYRGLSGLDSALFAALALDLWRRGGPDRRLGAAALLLFLAKVAAEVAGGQALFATGPFVPVPLAHLLGLVSAFAEACWRRPVGLHPGA